MPTITVGGGYTPPENYFSQEDGTYPVTLVRIGITDDAGEFHPFGTREYTGMYGLKIKQDWTFALENGEIIEVGVTAPKEQADGSLRIHPKSTYFAYISALAGGRPPAEGAQFDPEQHLIGRMALATIARDEQNIPRINNLGALPTGMAQAPAAVAQPAAPTTPAAAPPPAQAAPAAPEPVAAAAAPSLDSNLPW